MTKPLFFIDQHGCAKNQVDAELITGHLKEIGWERTDSAEKAKLLIVNSCGFIESAKLESITAVIQAKKQYPNAKILLAGCLAERYCKDDGSPFLEEADAFLGNGDISKIKDIVQKLFANSSTEKEIPVIIEPQNGVCSGSRPELFSFPASAYVKITEGCNNRCSFCAIPLIRGNLRSRSINEIVEEIQQLISKGIFEINLIGQDLASFGKDFEENTMDISPLASLLTEITKIKTNFWLRLLYIHPDNFNPDILPIIKNDSRLLPYFDIPFQSGDDTIIKKMNRHGNCTQYTRLVDKIRGTLPEAVIRTTFLTGFPSETEDQFTNTVKFIESIKPNWSGCFTYSKEDGTAAEKLRPSVPKKIAKQRKELIEEAQTKITTEHLKQYIDKVFEILIEEVIPTKENEETGFFIGRAWFQAPDVDGAVVVQYDTTNENQKNKVFPGNRVKARIINVNNVDLHGFMIVP
ncbi:MAG: 30S ribosomal protein S12 methylthiotransferase RimO [Spirochaetaceae bacterium]|nr:30S ribosomal protein S12 methylthiotransferase RimO [Spirochaetaceae bacterium]